MNNFENINYRFESLSDTLHWMAYIWLRVRGSRLIMLFVDTKVDVQYGGISMEKDFV
ncbi:MAG TPA: hypothetical protein PKV22_05690 [Paludibacteraceae bacterium]|nr:hypothetical protein [Paludibacteraceae bacterium]